jgi:hypothetical protein
MCADQRLLLSALSEYPKELLFTVEFCTFAIIMTLPLKPLPNNTGKV